MGRTANTATHPLSIYTYVLLTPYSTSSNLSPASSNPSACRESVPTGRPTSCDTADIAADIGNHSCLTA